MSGGSAPGWYRGPAGSYVNPDYPDVEIRRRRHQQWQVVTKIKRPGSAQAIGTFPSLRSAAFAVADYRR